MLESKVVEGSLGFRMPSVRVQNNSEYADPKIVNSLLMVGLARRFAISALWWNISVYPY